MIDQRHHSFIRPLLSQLMPADLERRHTMAAVWLVFIQQLRATEFSLNCVHTFLKMWGSDHTLKPVLGARYLIGSLLEAPHSLKGQFSPGHSIYKQQQLPVSCYRAPPLTPQRALIGPVLFQLRLFCYWMKASVRQSRSIIVVIFCFLTCVELPAVYSPLYPHIHPLIHPSIFQSFQPSIPLCYDYVQSSLFITCMIFFFRVHSHDSLYFFFHFNPFLFLHVV